jgi:Viral BACON domain
MPLPPEYLLTAKPPQPPLTRPRRRQPSLFFWVSVLMLCAVLLGGIVGVVLSLGHGALAQKLPNANEIVLQVTPASVALGNVITLRGSNFSPHGHIGLTRDTTIPIVDTGGNTIIQADSKGSFADTVNVEAEWQAGSHLIRAEDAMRHKSAAFTIVVTGHSPSLRPPHLLLSSGAIDLGVGDQATNSTKTITLTNGGGGQISWQSAATQSWLLLSPKNGTFSSGQNIQVTIAADRSNLQPGGYAGQVIFTSNAGQFMLPVKMKTTPLDPAHEAVLQLTPAVLSFTGVDGGSSPPAQILTVSNPGALPLQWSASTSSDWLSITPASSDVSKAGSQAVEVGVNTSLQLPGTYSGIVRFTGRGLAPTRDSPQNIYVSLTIMPQCALQLTPGMLSFTGVYLQPEPAAKTIHINATQACNAPPRWNAIATANNGEHWLHIGNTSGTTPSLPAVSINVEGLKPGIYSGSIIFSWLAGTQTMPVTFMMGQPTTPIISTSPASLTFSGIMGQPGPPGQVITIANSGGGTLNWQASAATNFGGTWLSIAPAAGTLASHQSKTMNVTVAFLNDLTPNTYTGMVTITGTDGSGHPAPGSPQSIPVSFTVLAPCTLAGTPSALSFAGVIGQPSPPAQQTTITASGACTHPLHWTASTSDAAWLTATPSSGTVGINSTATTNIGITLASLGVNTYTGQVTITATDSVTHKSVGAPQVITVVLNVQPTCTLQPASIPQENFSAEVGTGPNLASQSFTIGITGACQGNITITPAVTQNWLTVSPSAAVITGGSTTFTVTVKSASLAVGSYSDAVSVAAVDSKGITITGSPQTVNMALTVLAAPSLTVNPAPNGLTFNVTGGSTSQAISINNTGGEPLNWTAALGSDAPSFVSLSASAGSNLVGGASASDNVIVNASGVPGGTSYTTSLTVNAIDPITGNIVAGSPSIIPITINIAPPTMQLDTGTLAYTASAGINPQAQAVNLTNIGGKGLTWSAGAPSQPWLTLGLNTGSDNYQQTSAIPFNVDVTGMSSGSYTATVVITPSVGATQTVTVTLVIT